MQPHFILTSNIHKDLTRLSGAINIYIEHLIWITIKNNKQNKINISIKIKRCFIIDGNWTLWYSWHFIHRTNPSLATGQWQEDLLLMTNQSSNRSVSPIYFSWKRKGFFIISIENIPCTHLTDTFRTITHFKLTKMWRLGLLWVLCTPPTVINAWISRSDIFYTNKLVSSNLITGGKLGWVLIRAGRARFFFFEQ